jgi:SAM-dependent methyltransferase
MAYVPRNEVTSTSRAFDEGAIEAILNIPNYVDWMLRPFREHLKGRVVELGAGFGTVAQSYVDGVDEAVLLEPAENLFEHIVRTFANDPRVKPLCGFLEELVASGAPDLAPESFDAAFTANVLEHIRDDRAVLEVLRTRIKPGGWLLIFVPATPFLYGAIDARTGHFRRYTKASLREVVESAGFAVERIEYFDLLGMVPWFILGRVLRQDTVTAGVAGIYDRLVVPLCSLADRVTQKRIGKNLICTARRIER